LGGNSIGSFDPCDYSIKFRSATDINSYNVTAELFHAYQEQFLKGKLTQIVNSSNKKGGSNMEFEEAAMLMFAEMFRGNNALIMAFPGQEKLFIWVTDFFENRSSSSKIILTDVEKQSWFEALNEFQQFHWQNAPNSLRGSPVDHTMLPDTLLFLLNNSNCF